MGTTSFGLTRNIWATRVRFLPFCSYLPEPEEFDLEAQFGRVALKASLDFGVEQP